MAPTDFAMLAIKYVQRNFSAMNVMVCFAAQGPGGAQTQSLCVQDEAHAVKNRSAARTVRLNRFVLGLFPL